MIQGRSIMKTRSHSNKAHRSSAKLPGDGVIGAAIAHLKAPLRWVMILGETNGLSTKEIANLAGVSLKVVQSMQDRGLALIQRELLLGHGAIA